MLIFSHGQSVPTVVLQSSVTGITLDVNSDPVSIYWISKARNNRCGQTFRRIEQCLYDSLHTKLVLVFKPEIIPHPADMEPANVLIMPMLSMSFSIVIIAMQSHDLSTHAGFISFYHFIYVLSSFLCQCICIRCRTWCKVTQTNSSIVSML